MMKYFVGGSYEGWHEVPPEMPKVLHMAHTGNLLAREAYELQAVRIPGLRMPAWFCYVRQGTAPTTEAMVEAARRAAHHGAAADSPHAVIVKKELARLDQIAGKR